MKSLTGVLNNLSVILEVAVVVLGVLLAVRKKKDYGWLVAVAFGLYVIINWTSMYCPLQINASIFAVALFIASVIVLRAFYLIYKEK